MQSRIITVFLKFIAYFFQILFIFTQKQSMNNRRGYRYSCNLFYKKILFPIDIEKRILKTVFYQHSYECILILKRTELFDLLFFSLQIPFNKIVTIHNLGTYSFSVSICRIFFTNVLSHYARIIISLGHTYHHRINFSFA